MRWIRSAGAMFDLHVTPGTDFLPSVQLRYQWSLVKQTHKWGTWQVNPVNPDWSEKLFKQIHPVNTRDLHLLQDERQDSLIKYTGLPAGHLEGGQTLTSFSANKYKSMNIDAVGVFLHLDAEDSWPFSSLRCLYSDVENFAMVLLNIV